MTQPISVDQPLGEVRDRKVFVDPAWFRYFVDVGEVDLTADVSGVLPVANGGTGVATLTPTPIPITAFLNGWVNFGAPWAAIAYYKDVMNVVHLRGMMMAGAIASSAFVLPAGYRPLFDEYFAVASNGAFGSVFVTPAGDVTPQVGSNVWVSLSGISFRADA